MALRPTKPKKKKNPFRLSSDRQPEIEKANQRKRSRRFGRPPGSFEPPKYAIPRGPRRVPGMEPYRPMPTPGIKRFLDQLEKKKKKGLEPTPAQIERLKKLKEKLTRKS